MTTPAELLAVYLDAIEEDGHDHDRDRVAELLQAALSHQANRVGTCATCNLWEQIASTAAEPDQRQHAGVCRRWFVGSPAVFQGYAEALTIGTDYCSRYVNREAAAALADAIESGLSLEDLDHDLLRSLGETRRPPPPHLTLVPTDEEETQDR